MEPPGGRVCPVEALWVRGSGSRGVSQLRQTPEGSPVLTLAG